MDKPSTLTEQIADYISRKAKEKLEQLDKAAAKLHKSTDFVELADSEKNHQAEYQQIVQKFSPAYWLTDAAKRAGQIQIVTHALKFTHTDAQGSSVYDEGLKVRLSNNHFMPNYFNSSTLASPVRDIVGNAAVLDVAALLQLHENGRSLYDYIISGDLSPLQPFADSESQLQEWESGFKQVSTPKKIASHTLARQIFFPVNETQYHLLLPLFPSSLAFTLSQRIQWHYTNDEARSIRKAKKDKKYIEGIVVDYLDLAIQNFGGSKPQNVSQLNSKRHGQFYLFSCAPPHWDFTRISQPAGKSIFNGEYRRLVNKQLQQLRKYLKSISKKASTRLIRDQRQYEVENLFTLLFDYTMRLKTELPPGWSSKSRLSTVQQLWLDPGRQKNDLAFRHTRQQMNWQQQIAEEFALWLKRNISYGKHSLNLGDTEYHYLLNEIVDKQRLFQEDLLWQTEMEAVK